MPQMGQSAPPLLTKTKTRTKAIVGTALLVVGAGVLAAVGISSNNSSRMVCGSGSRVGQACTTDRDCRTGALSDLGALCKRVPTRTAPRTRSRGTPDLAIQSVIFDSTARRPAVIVINQGTAVVSWSGTDSYPQLQLQVFDATGREMLEGQRGGAILALAPGATFSYTWPDRVIPSGAVRMRVTLDTRFQVTESNEGNNVWEGPIPAQMP